MTKKEKLAIALERINEQSNGDWEVDHARADDLLIEYINDQRVSDAYNSIGKWYA